MFLFTCVIARRSRMSNWITDLDNSDLILITMRFVCIPQIFQTIFHVSSGISGKFCIFWALHVIHIIREHGLAKEIDLACHFECNSIS